MLRFAVFLIAVLFGTALLALNAERLLLFHFDNTRVSPADAGEGRLHEVIWTADDGAELVLWLGKPGNGRPTIMYFHGNAGNLAVRTGRFRKFLDRGFGVVAMAYPGSSGSSGEHSSEAFQNYAEGIYAALPDLVGPGPVVFYGESLGTGIAVQLAAKMPPAGMVLESPYTSIRDVGMQLYPRLADWMEVLPNPWPSVDLIGDIRAPLLILHGGLDQVIPVEMARVLFDASGSDDKHLYIVQNAGHTNVWQAQAQAKLFSFLEN